MSESTSNKGYPYVKRQNAKQSKQAEQDRAEQLDTDIEAPWDLNLQVEGEQASLACGSGDSTGVKYESKLATKLPQSLVDSNHEVYLEGQTTSSAGDEDVDLELYDEDNSSVVDSVTISGGGKGRKEVSGSLNADNDYHVRWNCTSLSSSSSETFDAHGARLVVE